MHKILVLILVLAAFTLLKAQQNNTLFLMHDLPQANIINPAVPIKCKLFVVMPIVGSTHINAYSTGFAFNDIFESYNGDSLKFNPYKAIHTFNTLEILATETHLSLLSVGYKYRENYITFSINEKINSYSILSKNALLLANEGNTQFVGTNANLDGTRINAVHYREFALGWAKKVNEKLDIGIRAKLLFGKSNIYTKPTKGSLYTHPITYALNLEGSVDLHSSYPVNITTDEEGKIDDIEVTEIDNIDKTNYLFNTKNKGLGFDLGIIYKLNQITTISASLLDIGYIKWNSDVNQFHSSGQIDITGETYDEGLNDYYALKDTLFNTFNPYITEESYFSPLVPTIYVGIERIIANTLEIGTVFHNEFYKKKWHPSISISANKNFGKIFSTGLSYTIQNKQFNNIGLGMGMKLGSLHLHALSDNIPAFFDIGKARNLNLRFGISFLFGCEESMKKDNIIKSHRAIPCTMGNPYKSVQRNRR